MDSNPIAPGATTVNDELEVGSDAMFEDRWFTGTRIGRYGLLLVVLLGLAGLLGGGPLDHGSVGSVTGGGRIDYQPVARFGTTTQITVHLPPGVNSFRIDNAFIEPLGLSQVSPEPMTERPDGGGARFVFSPATPGRQSLIRLRGKPSTVGLVPATVVIGDGEVRRWTELVLP